MAKGKYTTKKDVVRTISKLIEHYPNTIADTLKKSGTFIEKPFTKKELIDKTAHELAHNFMFQQNIAEVIANYEVLNTVNSYNNATGKVDKGKLLVESGKTVGKSTAGGAQSGGLFGAIAGAVVGLVSSGFKWGSAKKEAQISEEEYKQQLYGELFKKKKTNWIPIAIVGSVLIVAGIATYIALKK